MGKVTMVRLTCPSLGEREFEVSHAERLLSMQNNGGWQLSDKEYEYKNGSISRKANKGAKATAEA